MVEVPGRILLLDPNDLPERFGKKAAFALAKRCNEFAIFLSEKKGAGIFPTPFGVHH